MPAMKHLLAGVSLAILAASPALAQQKAGVAAGVRGEVLRVASKAGQPTNVGYKGSDTVFMGDAIESKPDAGMQVMLLDQTTFTIGPDSRLTIDEFVFDPAAGAGKVGASILKGGFRFVSGKVAANSPADMTVKTPAATIGIRGTAVFGIVGPTETIIALAGPGRNNDTGDKVAGVDIISPNGTAELRRAGFAARIITGQEPEIIRLTPDLLQRLQGALTPTGGTGASGTSTAQAAQGGSSAGASGGVASGPAQSGGAGSAPGAMREQGGMSNQQGLAVVAPNAPDGPRSSVPTTMRGTGDSALVQTLVSVSDLHGVAGLAPSQTASSITFAGSGSQEAGGASLTSASEISQGSGEFDLGDYTTVAQLVAAPAGVGTFSQTNVQLFDTNGGTGSYDFSLTVNFGSMNYTGGFSNINNAATGVSGGSLSMNQTSAPYLDPLAGAQASAACGSGATCTGTFLLRNNGAADVARFADHFLIIENGSTAAVGSGTATRP